MTASFGGWRRGYARDPVPTRAGRRRQARWRRTFSSPRSPAHTPATSTCSPWCGDLVSEVAPSRASCRVAVLRRPSIEEPRGVGISPAPETHCGRAGVAVRGPVGHGVTESVEAVAAFMVSGWMTASVVAGRQVAVGVALPNKADSARKPAQLLGRGEWPCAAVIRFRSFAPSWRTGLPPAIRALQHRDTLDAWRLRSVRGCRPQAP